MDETRRPVRFRELLAALVEGGVDFVIVGHDGPWECGVRRLEVRVELIERIAIAIFRECRYFARIVPAWPPVVASALVNVVAEMDNEVEILRRHVVVGGEIAAFVILVINNVVRRGDGGGDAAVPYPTTRTRFGPFFRGNII